MQDSIIHEERADYGRITLDVMTVEDTELRIVVEDNGIGISGDDLRELREFVPGRISKKCNGTGFGLPTAQRYVEAHAGDVIIESTENVGTTVSLHFAGRRMSRRRTNESTGTCCG